MNDINYSVFDNQYDYQLSKCILKTTVFLCRPADSLSIKLLNTTVWVKKNPPLRLS